MPVSGGDPCSRMSQALPGTCLPSTACSRHAPAYLHLQTCRKRTNFLHSCSTLQYHALPLTGQQSRCSADTIAPAILPQLSRGRLQCAHDPGRCTRRDLWSLQHHHQSFSLLPAQLSTGHMHRVEQVTDLVRLIAAAQQPAVVQAANSSVVATAKWNQLPQAPRVSLRLYRILCVDIVTLPGKLPHCRLPPGDATVDKLSSQKSSRHEEIVLVPRLKDTC